jgi:hypothetical protein
MRSFAPILALATAVAGAPLVAQQPAAPARPGAVRGMVYDSLAGVPLRGATVQLARADDRSRSAWSAVTDSLGNYAIDSVPAGQYIAGFFHPAADSLGFTISPRPFVVEAGAPVGVPLGIPAGPTIRRALCPPTADTDSTGLLFGMVRNVETGAPMAGGTVVVMWQELVIDRGGIRNERRQFPAKSGEDGAYYMCGVPSDIEVEARAEHPQGATGYIAVRVPLRGAMKRDLAIGTRDTAVVAAMDSLAPGAAGARLRRGSAALSGTVLGPGKRPLRGARVVVGGTGAETETDEAGRFALADLPSGTQSLEARALGYQPKRATVDLSRERPATVDVVLDERTPVLDAVSVYGKATPRRSLSGFLERRRNGMGRYATREDIERQGALYLTDVLRRMPGVRVAPTNRFGSAVYVRGAGLSGYCRPALYLDGMRMFDDGESSIDDFVRPGEVAAVEVYAGVAGAPAEFDARGCGAIVIWTGQSVR